MENSTITEKTQHQLEEFGLNWRVNKEKLYLHHQDDLNETPFYATVRSDTRLPLGVVKDRYEPKQNGEILQILRDAGEKHDLQLHDAGVFNGGKRIFMLLKMPENLQVNGDEVEKYLFAMTGHDGSASLRFGLTNIVMSCQNQWNYFMKRSKFTLRHTQSIHNNATLLQEKIAHILLGEENLYAIFKRFLDTDVDTAFVQATIHHTMKMDKYLEKNDGEISTRKENQILELAESVTEEMDEKGGNAWGLFNGITHYANYKKSAPKRENGRLESILSGGANKFMTRGFQYMTKELGIPVNLN